MPTALRTAAAVAIERKNFLVFGDEVDYKTLRGGVVFIDAIPKSAFGKVSTFSFLVVHVRHEAYLLMSRATDPPSVLERSSSQRTKTEALKVIPVMCHRVDVYLGYSFSISNVIVSLEFLYRNNTYSDYFFRGVYSRLCNVEFAR